MHDLREVDGVCTVEPNDTLFTSAKRLYETCATSPAVLEVSPVRNPIDGRTLTTAGPCLPRLATGHPRAQPAPCCVGLMSEWPRQQARWPEPLRARSSSNPQFDSSAGMEE